MAAHVGLSLIVLQAFVRGTKRWLAYAIAFHFLFDLAAVLLTRYWHVDTVLVEVLLFVCGVVLLWLGLRWSRRMTGPATRARGMLPDWPGFVRESSKAADIAGPI